MKEDAFSYRIANKVALTGSYKSEISLIYRDFIIMKNPITTSSADEKPSISQTVMVSEKSSSTTIKNFYLITLLTLLY